MGKVERHELWMRLANRPNSVRLEELDQLLRLFGWELHNVRGSHHHYRRGAARLSIPLHRPTLKAVYVRRALAVMQEQIDDA
ncbi:MAG: hypothetical protein C0506_00540 [Anaerolinea sp.]|nr:hypothetical protein [Anaerolinea sp.]